MVKKLLPYVGKFESCYFGHDANGRRCWSSCCIIPSFFFICHIYPPFTRKRIVSLYFGRDVRTRLGVATSEGSGPPVFHIKAGSYR